MAAATDATAGMVITYGGKPIAAHFSTSSGGYLTDSAWSDNAGISYLVAKPDPWSLKAPVPPWTASPGYPWTYTISPTSLASKLGVSVGAITNVQVTARDTSDPTSHARTLRITGTTGSTTMTARTFKSKLGLKSTLILISPGILRHTLPRDRLTPGLHREVVDLSTTGPSGGSYARAKTSGASVTVTFTGTYLAWIATAGKTVGKAYVSLTAARPRSSTWPGPRSPISRRSGTPAPRVRQAHGKIWWYPDNPVDKYISIDAFDVLGTLN